ncbi:Endoglucanase precursor [compost metagenome]
MLMRAFAYETDRKVEESGHLYADQSSISAWAQDAVNAAHSLGIIQGRGDNQFIPQGTATRAESAVLIVRLLEALK